MTFPAQSRVSRPGRQAEGAVAYQPIGTLRSPYADVAGMPIQPVGARGIQGHIEVAPEFAAGLKDLNGFSHVIVLYHLHRINGYELLVRPFLDTQDHGIFATRSPKRPNAIGLSVLELVGVELAGSEAAGTGGVVHLRNVDILDGTPVLDIKPYVPAFDVWEAGRIGWFAGKVDEAETCKADERFR
ncbi:MAG: tRNA (N6-threonylcarbamoyladenosine(37)-N6)-methyltransferase TrmO [Humidesulfovibrio sp.]|nr:tRNA (N6-threonylcarbamoyladenosine(37)-N6)-methyltransferase TrmO [Humidesulfovibrio sp.]